MSWIRVVPVDEMVATEYYILARQWQGAGDRMSYDFYSHMLNGKERFTVKPGIAIHYLGDDRFKKVLADNPNMVALAIPKDYKTRWRARKPAPYWRKRT